MKNRHIAVIAGISVALMVQSSASFAQLASNKSNAPSTIAPVITVQEQEAPNLNLTWELVPRPPIKFTPFDMVDPNTGKPVKPSDIIEVNGVKMRAGDFYRRLNETERWLNAYGYSLRTDTRFEYYSPELESQIADSERRLRELEAQMPSEGEPGGTDFTPAACNSDSRVYSTGWYGNSLWGIRFSASGGYQACSAPLSASVSGQAVLSGRLANFERNLAEATGNASAQLAGSDVQYSYAINVKVLGNTVWGPSGSGSFAVDSRYTNSWDWQIASVNWNSPTIPLGCVSIFGINVCLNGQVGVSGSLRLAASVDASLFGQIATVRPYGGLSGWAAAWIGVNGGIARAEAGVRGTLNFLSGGLQGSAQGNFNFVFSNNRLCLYYNLQAGANANLTALSGTVDAYARGCIWFFGWRCAEASLRLFSWNGISWNQANLWSYSNRYQIYCQ